MVALMVYQIGSLFTGGGFTIWTVVAFIVLIGMIYLLVRPYKESAVLKVNPVVSKKMKKAVK